MMIFYTCTIEHTFSMSNIIMIKIIFVLFLNFFLTNVVTSEGNVSNYENKGFVANGEIYDTEKYPFVVCILMMKVGRESILGKSLCTGSLISQWFVLTAAHCTVKVEKYDIDVYHDSDHRRVQRVYRHSMYNPKTFSADISLLKLRKPFQDVGYYISLSGHPDEFSDGKSLNCVVIGFGLTGKKQMSNLIGFMTNSNVTFGPTACEMSNQSDIMETWKEYLCSKPDIHMICPGDSGGPMICNGSLYGIASHGYNFKDRNKEVECGSADVQTRHLFLYTYRKWITDITSIGNTLIPHYKLYITTVMLVLYIMNV